MVQATLGSFSQLFGSFNDVAVILGVIAIAFVLFWEAAIVVSAFLATSFRAQAPPAAEPR